MSEEDKPAENLQRIICVCAKCGGHSTKTSIEFNFRDKKIYQICPDCNFHNSMSIEPPLEAKRYPKIKTMR